MAEYFKESISTRCNNWFHSYNSKKSPTKFSSISIFGDIPYLEFLTFCWHFNLTQGISLLGCQYHEYLQTRQYCLKTLKWGSAQCWMFGRVLGAGTLIKSQNSSLLARIPHCWLKLGPHLSLITYCRWCCQLIKMDQPGIFQILLVMKYMFILWLAQHAIQLNNKW